MKQHTQKAIHVMAEQFTGQPIEGLQINHPEIIFSLDGKLYYPTNCRCRAWLSLTSNELYDFATWSVKSGDRKPVDQSPEMIALAMRYVSQCGLTEQPQPYAFIDRGNGKSDEVKVGEWLVKYSNGILEVLSDEVFQQRFHSAE